MRYLIAISGLGTILGCGPPAGSPERLAELLEDPLVVAGLQWAKDGYEAHLTQWEGPGPRPCLLSPLIDSDLAERSWAWEEESFGGVSYDLSGSLQFGSCYTHASSDGTRVGPCAGTLRWAQEGINLYQQNTGETSQGSGDGWVWGLPLLSNCDDDGACDLEKGGSLRDGSLLGYYAVVQYNEASDGVCSQTLVNLLTLAVGDGFVLEEADGSTSVAEGCNVSVLLDSTCGGPTYSVSTWTVASFGP